MLMEPHPETIYPNYAAVSAECCPTTPMKLGGEPQDDVRFSEVVRSLYEEWQAASEGEGVNIW